MYKIMKNTAYVALALASTMLPGCFTKQVKKAEIPEINFQEDMDRLAQYKKNIESIMDYSERSVRAADSALATQQQSHDLGHKVLQDVHQIMEKMTPGEIQIGLK